MLLALSAHSVTQGTLGFKQITLLQCIGTVGAFCQMPKHLRAKCLRVESCNAYHRLLLLDGIRWA